MTFERHDTDFIKQKASESIENIKIGRVTKIYEHTSDDDNSNYEADVRILGEDFNARHTPIAHSARDSIDVPLVGDKVVVDYFDGNEKNPVITDIIYTNKDRPVKGKAGVSRKRIQSGLSNAGPGDLYIEGFTDWSGGDPTTIEKDALTAEKSRYRIAKKDDDTDELSLPMTIEMVDESGNTHILLESNGGASSMRLKLDVTNDTAEVSGGGNMGMKLYFGSGAFKLLDAGGYGIESDGSGNIVVHHNTVDFAEGSTTSL